MKNFILLISIFLASILSSCSPKINKLSAYSNIYKEKPLSIMIMPPINKSTKVDAKMSFYNTLAMPIADNGYYVFPPSLSMQFLQDQSAYDAELLLDKSMVILNQTFNADAVLFTTIHDWRKVTIGSAVIVKIEYLLKSAKTDEVLFNRIGLVKVNASGNTGSVIADLAVGMLKTAFTKEVAVAKSCNNYSLIDIPKGKYSTLYGTDQHSPAGKKEFSITLSQ